MAVTKERGKWRATPYSGGFRLPSKTFERKQDAMAYDADQRRKGAKPVSKRTVGDLLEKYQREVTPTKIGKDWEHKRLDFWMQQDLALLPANVGSEQLGKWRDERLKGKDGQPAVSGSTVNRDIHLLSHVFKIAWKEWGWLTDNPWTGVRRPKEAQPRDRLVSDEEVALLRQVSGDTPTTIIGRSVFAFRFAIETGMRSGEILAMRKEHDKGSYVHLPAHQAGAKKSGKRDVPLTAEARAILDQVKQLELDIWGMSDSQRQANFNKAVKNAGIEGMTFHDSRHTAVTRLARKLSVLELARMIGHRDINQLRTYFNESPEEMAKKLL